MRKLYTTLIAVIMTLTAIAQTTPTTMKVNLSNGISQTFNIADIADVTFESEEWGGEVMPPTPTVQGVVEIEIPEITSYSDSKVYKVMLGETKIAEICLEYINTLNAQKMVIYPTDTDGKAILTKGVSLSDGGSVVWNESANTVTYTAGTNSPAQQVYYENGKFVWEPNADELEASEVVADKIQDNRGLLEKNSYGIVKIGTQYWMSENLKAKFYRDGSAITNIQSSQIDSWKNTTAGAYHPFADDTDFETLYGEIYNAYAFKDSRGLAPQGWDIPELSDYSALKSYLGTSSGNKMKSTVPMDWNDSGNTAYTPTDLSGFSANAAGCFLPLSQGDGGDTYLGSRTYFWTKTTGTDSTFGTTGYMYVGLTNVTKALFIATEPRDATFGYYIRCIRK